ncbi:MAG: endonuclease III [Rickettsiales bacterium]|nr:endonuclease III [Rickettsiales bacterium]
MKKRFDTGKLTELHNTNEFTLAVAVILSAQATDKKVNEVTPGLFAVADTPEKMLALGEEGLKSHIKVISFFNNKARNIIKLAEVLTTTPALRATPSPAKGNYRSGGDKTTTPSAADAAATPSPAKGNGWKFPEKYHDRDELMKLPGIGQKTANVVSNVLWGAPNIGVDTHVFRLSHRFGWVGGADNTPEKVEARLIPLIPKKHHRIVNHIMVMHGRYICKALRPDCENCPVAGLCPVYLQSPVKSAVVKKDI